MNLPNNGFNLIKSENLKVYSKFGGLPEMPLYFPWPKSALTYLNFLAQIEIPHGPSENSEILYFFYNFTQMAWGYNHSDKRYFKVLYHNGDTLKLKTRKRPRNKFDVFPEYKITIETSDIPNQNHQLFGEHFKIQDNLFWDAEMAFQDIDFEDFTMLSERRQKKVIDGSNEWVLLLQLDTDEDLDWHWGDSGMLYFVIKKQDLAENKFNKVRAILHSF